MKPLCLCMTLILSALLVHAQMDKPAPEDLVDQLASERKKTDQEVSVLQTVRNHLNALTGGDTADPEKIAAVVEADCRICLAKGDFNRKESELYGKAAEAAGQVAKGWEEKAARATGDTPSNAGEEKFHRQMEELNGKIGDLEAKTPLTGEDQAQLAALRSRRKQLEGALALLARVRGRIADPAKYAEPARQMRAQEKYFQLKAEDSRLQALTHDIECVSAVLTLRELEERDIVQKELDRWREVTSPGRRK